jgi:hypothetical protein
VTVRAGSPCLPLPTEVLVVHDTDLLVVRDIVVQQRGLVGHLDRLGTKPKAVLASSQRRHREKRKREARPKQLSPQGRFARYGLELFHRPLEAFLNGIEPTPRLWIGPGRSPRTELPLGRGRREGGCMGRGLGVCSDGGEDGPAPAPALPFQGIRT